MQMITMISVMTVRSKIVVCREKVACCMTGNFFSMQVM